MSIVSPDPQDNTPRPSEREFIAIILMEHAELGRCLEGTSCRCGWAGQGHAGHVADALLHHGVVRS